MRLSFRLRGTSSFVTKTGDCPDVSGNDKQPACCARQCLPTSDCFISGKPARTAAAAAAANGDLRQGTDCMTQRHAATYCYTTQPDLGVQRREGLCGKLHVPMFKSLFLFISEHLTREAGRPTLMLQ